jgi:ACR3 family arsenite efflux pump ArsB
MVRETSWVFATLECIHLYSLIVLIGLVATFDMRLMGFSLSRERRVPLSQFAGDVLRWVWIPIVVNGLTGLFLFASKAPEYTNNSAFQVKIALIFLTLAYHTIFLFKAQRWDDLPAMPLQIKLVGGFSLLVWFGVIAASRWIAYV